MTLRAPALLLTLLLIALPAGAQTSHVQTFPLHHRPVEELAPLLKPVVPGAVITGTGYTLIVRGTLDQLVDVERLLGDLDVAQVPLLITVRQGGRLDDEGGGAGRVERRGRDSVTIYETDRRRNDRTSQQLRVNEGSWAHITSGRSLPLPEQNIVYGPGGMGIQQSTRYRDVASGFEVRPRVTGDRVTLDIRPFRSAAAPSAGAIDTQEVQTTVSGRLGEWIEVAGGDDSSDRSGSAIVYSTRSRASETRDVYVKVERVR